MGRQFITTEYRESAEKWGGGGWKMLEILVECLQQQVTPEQARGVGWNWKARERLQQG